MLWPVYAVILYTCAVPKQRLRYVVFDVPGTMQCLVQLSTLPVAVCHGTGKTREEAHGEAAYNALQYLKIMTMK